MRIITIPESGQLVDVRQRRFVVTDVQQAVSQGLSSNIATQTPFRKEVADRANIYIWDRDKRSKDAEGRCGSLHIKCAICDRQHLFITSANLTGYALSINMEMGILVHSHELTNQVVNHFDQLIRQDILVKI